MTERLHCPADYCFCNELREEGFIGELFLCVYCEEEHFSQCFYPEDIEHYDLDWSFFRCKNCH